MYNTGIEIAMFKGSRTDIENDTETLRRSNQKKIAQLELSFLEKVAREEQLSKLEQQIEMVCVQHFTYLFLIFMH